MTGVAPGAWKAQAARAMAELRLADALVEPGTAEQVAERTGTGELVFERVHGESFWDYLRSHEEAGRIFVLETVLPDEQDGVSPDSAPIHLLDLMMLLNFGARERTLDEYAALLEEAGFGEVRLTGDADAHVVVATRR